MAAKLTKKEAVRQALAALGNDARPISVQAWVKDNLSIEMTAAHVSTTKGELLREASKKKATEQSPASAAESASAAVQPAPVVLTEKLSKNEAVRQAIAALGAKAKRGQIQTWVKEHLGIDMSIAHVSTARADALRKLKGQHKAVRKHVVHKASNTPSTVVPATPPSPARSKTGVGEILVEDMLMLQGLLRRVGPATLRTLIDASSSK